MSKIQAHYKASEKASTIHDHLAGRSIVLIGLMGAGKTSIGRRLAARLDLPFTDADTEIEIAAGKSISEIFADHGEAHFRQGESKVIERLLNSAQQVLATGGGAYMCAQTRENVAKRGLSIWLRAELELLMKRVSRRNNRPLLMNADPEETMKRLISERHPVYARADLVIDSRDEPHDVIVGEIIDTLAELYGDPR
jgi:shikimate kinase